MSTGPPENKELLIASVTPQNIERGELWFTENANSIKKARYTNPWWRDNAMIVEKDLELRLYEFIQRLSDFGYERVETAKGKGLFAVRGGTVEVWPLNSRNAYLIEFAGNRIDLIRPREDILFEVELQTIRSRTSNSLPSLAPGSFVVHVDHGIGIFQGLAPFRGLASEGGEFFKIEYAPARTGGTPDMLYVPLDQKNRLSPYVGFETPRIHRLGGTVWQNIKRKVREEVEKLAKELLLLYEGRAHAERAPYYGDETLENEVRSTFQFEETKDQLRAEREIMEDLARPKPMDRILCGDVGFGKTEVALRAALRVIASGKQVALLTPTTILAAQHEKTFSERIGGLPIKIGMLSRLTLPKDKKQMLKDLREGRMDCVIGTHRLLSKDVIFKRLGLVIIDEEQRFGVKQKERFKDMRKEVDLLSLSATPIPRTLSLAMAKLRDISLIETPPPERMPIITSILPYAQKIIKNAMAFEIERGGQIYFLHNRIETIDKTKEKLLSLLPYIPNLRSTGNAIPRIWSKQIGILHGRMKEKDVVATMEKFRNKEFPMLLATTIIENGLDISSANTLIVDDATRLGLAEAHQLRGRIGRGMEQAFAYFFYKPRNLTEKAAARLEALKEYSELGAGYQIALRDLEIRGAGNVLGREQSGAINKVGLNLYCQMLADATGK